MAHGGGQRPRAKPKALDKPAANIAVAAMPLEHADLQQIPLRIGMPQSIAKWQVGLYAPGEDFARNDADDRCPSVRCRYAKSFCGDRRTVYGIASRRLG